jgi:HNH endonuclease
VPEYPKRRDQRIGFGDPAIVTYEQLRMVVLCRSDGELVWRNGAPMVVLRPGKCERCGHWYATEAHHRWLRSQGGPDIASNLAALCRDCHNWCHANPAAAHKDGWMLVAGDKPSEVPVTLAGGLRALLTDEGGYIYLWETPRGVSEELTALVQETLRARAETAG